MKKLFRYPGVKPFETSEAGQFFGRQRDIQELSELILLEKLVVLFGKSGYGKSSLLNAGLIPYLNGVTQLPGERFLPLTVRFNSHTADRSATLVQAMMERLANQWPADSESASSPVAPADSLWEYFRNHAATNPHWRYVLIFDQFEEFFTHPHEQQAQFREQLAELLYTEIPQEIRDRWDSLSQEEKDRLSEPLDVRVVFAIREDRLSWLDSMKDDLPAILHKRYELKGLSDEQAREVIVKPAALPEALGFVSPSFGYSEEALQILLRELKKGGTDTERGAGQTGRIEAFLLQICCENIERRMIDRRAAGNPDVAVDPSDLPRFDRLYEEYYNRKISELPAEDQELARRLIENELVSVNPLTGIAFRISADGRKLAAMPGLTAELLKHLTDGFLLRAEPNTTGGFNYELSHDILLAPVLKAKEARLAEERRRAEAAAHLEREKELAEERKKRQRARTYAIIFSVLAAAALAATVYAFLLRNQALTAQTKAEASALAAKAWRVYQEDHTMAFHMAQAALDMDTTNEEAHRTMLDIINNSKTTFYKTGFFKHQFEVTSADMSPDGNLVATGSFDNDIYVWKKDGSVAHYFPGKRNGISKPGHRGKVTEVMFSPGGDTLFSTGIDGMVKLWSLERDSLEAEFPTDQTIYDADLSSDGQLLLTVGTDSTARLWNPEGELLQIFTGHQDEVLCGAIAPDNRFIATGSRDGTVKIWDRNGALRKTIELEGININDIDVASDNFNLLLGGSDHNTRLLTIDGEPLKIFGGHSAEVSSVQFSPDGRLILTGSYDHTVKLWSRSGQELLQLTGHQERVDKVAFSPDGNWAITGSWDFSAKLWNLNFNLQNRENRHNNYVTKVKAAPDGEYLISGSADFTVKKWSFEGQCLATMIGHSGNVAFVDISPDGRYFLSASDDKTVRLWQSDGNLLQVNAQFNHPVERAVFLPDGKSYATADLEGKISIWETASSRLLKSWTAHNDGIRSLAFSPDGTTVYSAGGDGFIRGWTAAGDTLFSLDNGGVPLWSIAVSSTGDTLLSAGVEYPVKLWLPETGSQAKPIFGHLNEIYHLAYSRSGEKFVSSSWDHTARVWTGDGKLLHTLNHPDGVYGAGFTPDDRLVITACRDRVIRIWDNQTGRLVNTIGELSSPSAFVENPDIAALADVEFDWERYGVSAETAATLYGDRPYNLVKRALNRLSKGIASLGNYEEGLQYFDDAESILETVRKYSTAPSLPLDSLEAEIYRARADHYLLNGKFDLAARAAKEGLRFEQLDWLHILYINAQLLSGDSAAALEEAEKINGQIVSQISFYEGMSFEEAIAEELYFYQTQYGIDSPEVVPFLEALQQEEE